MKKRILLKASIATENINTEDIKAIKRIVEREWPKEHPGEQMCCIIVIDGGRQSPEELIRIFQAGQV